MNETFRKVVVLAGLTTVCFTSNAAAFSFSEIASGAAIALPVVSGIMDNEKAKTEAAKKEKEDREWEEAEKVREVERAKQRKIRIAREEAEWEAGAEQREIDAEKQAAKDKEVLCNSYKFGAQGIMFKRQMGEYKLKMLTTDRFFNNLVNEAYKVKLKNTDDEIDAISTKFADAAETACKDRGLLGIRDFKFKE